MTRDAIQPSRLDDVLEGAAADHVDEIGDTAVASAIQAAVVREGELVYSKAVGRTHLEDVDGPGRADIESRPVAPSTPFDVASLTKPFVVGTLLFQAVSEGLVRLDAPLSEDYPDWSTAPAAASVTWAQLANHTSGLPDWRALYDHCDFRPDAPYPERRRHVRRLVRETAFDAEPGERETYSDLGYLVLGWALESVLEDRLYTLARRRVFDPLGLDETDFVPVDCDAGRLATAPATEYQPDRGRLVIGRVHDRNAAAIGGVAGHAGCFGTARDLARFGAAMLALDAGARDRGLGIDPDVLRRCWANRSRGGVGHHVVGWDTPSGSPSSAGRGFQAGRTVGHLGFTGTSIWLERDRALVAVLSTNRVYPDRDNDRIGAFRREFHEALLPP